MDISLASITGANYRPEDAEHVRDLAAKIDREGFRSDLYGAVTVTDRGDGTYSLESGFHRTAAARLLGLETIPAVVVDAGTDADRLVAQLDGNAHRLDAPAWAEAEALGQLIELGETVADLSRKLGHSTAYIDRRLGLLKLDPAVRRMGLGFVWTDALADLPWAAQRELVRKLDDNPMNRGAWSALCQTVREELTAPEGMFDVLELDQEVWDSRLDQWAQDARNEASEASEPRETVRELVLGIKEVGEYLGLSKAAIYKRVQRGQLPPADLEVSGQDAWFISTIDSM